MFYDMKKTQTSLKSTRCRKKANKKISDKGTLKSKKNF